MRLLPLIFAVSAALFGCASAPQEQFSYPAAYKQALIDFPGSSNVDPATLDTFVIFLSQLGTEQTAQRAKRLYAPTLHFSDALMLTRSRDKVVEHFQGLVESGTAVNVEILQTLAVEGDIYLVWSMTAEFTPIKKTVISDTIGVTHIRFDDAGQVVMHQDFWDTGLGFYQQIPVLGGIVKSINGRFIVEDPP